VAVKVNVIANEVSDAKSSLQYQIYSCILMQNVYKIWCWPWVLLWHCVRKILF